MLDNLRKRFSGRQKLRPPSQLQPLARHHAGLWPEHGDEAARARVYQQSPWVYIAINRIAEAAALVPLQVLRLQGERRLAVERHPLERLLDAPNPQHSRFALMEQTVGMLELTGNAYWLLSGAGAAPTQIWPLRPDRVSIVPDAAGHVRGYVYEIDGQRIPLEAAEVLHFRRWHPSNDYYGLSALEAGRLAIRSDRAMAQWNHNTFGQDNGVPAGIVSIRDFVSDADYERIKREWRQSYGGPQRRTAFLRGGGISWQNIGLSHNELDFLKGREAHRNEILNLFGIPVGLVSENATEANARVAERHLHRAHAVAAPGAHRQCDHAAPAALLAGRARGAVRGHPPHGQPRAPGGDSHRRARAQHQRSARALLPAAARPLGRAAGGHGRSRAGARRPGRSRCNAGGPAGAGALGALHAAASGRGGPCKSGARLRNPRAAGGTGLRGGGAVAGGRARGAGACAETANAVQAIFREARALLREG